MTGRIDTGRLDTGRLDTGRLDTGRLDTGQLAQLLQDGNSAEVACTDHKSGDGYLLTILWGPLALAPFLSLDARQLRRDVMSENTIRIGAYPYRIEPSFVREFLELLAIARTRSERPVHSLTVTIQGPSGLCCYLGRDARTVAEWLTRLLPRSLELPPESAPRDAREQGRKIGYAAKDRAAIRTNTLSPESLRLLEQSGEHAAYAAVTKSAVVALASWEQMQSETLPAVAFLAHSLYRILRPRPTRGTAYRAIYIALVPRLFRQLAAAKDVDDAVRRLQRVTKSLDAQAGAAIVGLKFMQAIHDMAGDRQPGKLVTVARDIESTTERDAAWQLALASLSLSASPHAGPRERRLPGPQRTAKRLNELERVGPQSTETKADALVNQFGLTGLEVGKWVGRSEGRLLLRWVSDSFADLRRLLGQWTDGFMRAGNLALALGSRGKGSGCATYDATLTVINLTKLKGDGSLAHEWGHFLDHQIARYERQAASRFLSACMASQRAAPQHPIARQMQRVMESIQRCTRRERVEAQGTVQRYFPKRWIVTAWRRSQQSPQRAFDTLVRQYPHQFVHGKHAREATICLAESIAKWTGRPTTIDVTYRDDTDFFRQAKMLSAYWRRPEELFARAFESYVEDELYARAWKNEYLVEGTRANYESCLAWPYPRNAERRAIHAAMRDLLQELAATVD